MCFASGTAWRTLPVLVLVCGALGCGPKHYPVRGKVTYPDGTPVTEGMVVFESKGVDKPITARGEIQRDGRYELGTNKPGDGALAGTYRVLVAPKTDPNAVEKPAQAPPFDPRYSAFNTSELVYEVKAEVNEFPITVTRFKKGR